MPTRVAHGTVSEVASGNMVPGLPADIAADDILACLSGSNDGVTHTMDPAVWTPVYVTFGPGPLLGGAVHWARYDGSAPDTTVTHVAGDAGLAVIVAYRGCVGGSNVVDASSSLAGSGITMSWPVGVVPTFLNNLCLYPWVITNPVTIDPLSGFDPEVVTQLHVSTALGLGLTLGYADGINTSGNSLEERTSKASGTTGGDITGVVLLRDVEELVRQEQNPERYCVSRPSAPSVGA